MTLLKAFWEFFRALARAGLWIGILIAWILFTTTRDPFTFQVLIAMLVVGLIDEVEQKKTVLDLPIHIYAKHVSYHSKRPDDFVWRQKDTDASETHP